MSKSPGEALLPGSQREPPSSPKVSVIIPVRDEIDRLPALFESLERQQRRPDEVVIADGRSTDGSLQWLTAAACSRPWLRVVDNPKRIVPTGLNKALEVTTGELVARMDAHADYDADYLDQLVVRLQERPDLDGVGGAMATAGRGAWGKAIAALLRRSLGLGGARHRTGVAGGPIEHVFTGCYRRSALLDICGFDERLAANEDFELDHRLVRGGRLLWLEPAARSTWYVRESPAALARQMWRYGYHKALTLRLHPRSLRLRQLAPPVLVAGLVAALALRPRVGFGAALSYLSIVGVLGARAAANDGASPRRGAVVPPVVHLSWGAGLLVGLARFAGARPRHAGGLRGGSRS